MAQNSIAVATEAKLALNRARPVGRRQPECRGHAVCARTHGHLFLPEFREMIRRVLPKKADTAEARPDYVESDSLWRAASGDSANSLIAAPARLNRSRLSALRTRT